MFFIFLQLNILDFISYFEDLYGFNLKVNRIVVISYSLVFKGLSLSLIKLYKIRKEIVQINFIYVI